MWVAHLCWSRSFTFNPWIRPILGEDTVNLIASFLVSSRLDYANACLFGISVKNLRISITENSKHTCSCRHMLQISVQFCPSVETPPLASSLSPHSLQNRPTNFQVTPHHSSVISFIPHLSQCSFARPPLFQCSASLCPSCQLRIRISGF